MLFRSYWLNILNNFRAESFFNYMVGFRSYDYVSLYLKIVNKKNFLVLEKNFILIRAWLALNFRTNKIFVPYIGFAWFRFVLFSGLGYKRRIYKKFKLIFTYIGDRHWILYKFAPSALVAAHRRRNFVFYSYWKGQFVKDYDFFSSLRKPYVYKMKGFLDSRVRGRFLFVRRIKIRGIRTKLSKKQQLL